MTSITKLIVSIAICLTTGGLSGFFTASSLNEFYPSLNKPTWNPPGWIFGPVWTVLYIMMGISLWLIWRSNAPQQIITKLCLIFAAQLFLNFWWSVIFFKFQSPAFALIEILVLLLMIVITIFQFNVVSKTAAWLLVPYAAWVSFASILNYTIWKLN